MSQGQWGPRKRAVVEACRAHLATCVRCRLPSYPPGLCPRGRRLVRANARIDIYGEGPRR